MRSHALRSHLPRWIISIIFMLFYMAGAYDQVMMLSFNAVYYSSKGFTADTVAYFTNYPWPFLLLWITNIYAALAAGLLLLFRQRLAQTFALISAVSIVALELLTFTLRDRWHALGAWVSVFDVVCVAGATVAFYVYARWMLRQK